MASSMAIQRAAALRFLRPKPYFPLNLAIRTLSTSSALPNQYQPHHRPPPPHNPNPNPNPNQWNNNPPPHNPNQWNRQPPYQNPNANPSQWNRHPQPQNQYQNPNPNQWNPNPPAHNPNQWNRPLQYQNPNHQPHYQNPNPAAVAPPPPPPPPGPVDLLALACDGKIKEAVDLINQGFVLPDAPGFFNLIAACSDPKYLEDLKRIYEAFIRSPFRSDLEINHKLIEVFAKCGSMSDARKVFDRIPERNLDTWHLMIHGYAANGQGDDGLQLFEQMRKLGILPNSDTFVAVLAACGAAEAVEEGFIHLNSMNTEYRIQP